MSRFQVKLKNREANVLDCTDIPTAKGGYAWLTTATRLQIKPRGLIFVGCVAVMRRANSSWGGMSPRHNYEERPSFINSRTILNWLTKDYKTDLQKKRKSSPADTPTRAGQERWSLQTGQKGL